VRPVAVLDSSVVVAGIGWAGGEARKVLALLANRGFSSVRTPWLTAEWVEVTERVSKELKWRNPNWADWLDWIKRASVLVEDPPIKRLVRRDPNDDPVIALGVAANATFLVAYDKDLVSLGKPYGVKCLSPRAFLGEVLGA